MNCIVRAERPPGAENDGAAGVTDRAIAGTAIIYAASALGALVMAVMRSYAIVRRD